MPRTSARLSVELVRCAARRIAPGQVRTEADLRRATSDLYYALFHVVCEEVAGLLVVEEPTNASTREQYLLLYRLPNHGPISQRCRDALSRPRFSATQRAFMEMLISMKAKRDLADYDPLAQFNISEVENDLKRTHHLVEAFIGAQEEERRHVALFLAVDGRKTR